LPATCFTASHTSCRLALKDEVARGKKSEFRDFFLDTPLPSLYTFRNCNNCVAAQGRIDTMATKKAAKKPAKKAAKKAAKKK
jgi:hypothetical protein